MGEAMSEGGVFAHRKARALLEVVRLAFECEFGFESGFTEDTTCATTTDDADGAATHSPARHKAKQGKQHAQQLPAHTPHRPASTGSSSRLVPGGPCTWCGVTATPQWRRPRGTNMLLCNACGIFFTRYGRLPEKSHHVYGQAHPGPAAASETAEASTAAADAAAAAVAAAAALTADATTSPDDNTAQPAANMGTSGGGAQPDADRMTGRCRDPLLVQLQPLSLQKWQQQQKKQQRLLQQQQQQSQQREHAQLTASTASAVSPHKRKDAPQPEAELLAAAEDYSSGSTCFDSAASAAAVPAPPRPPPAPALQPPPASGSSAASTLPGIPSQLLPLPLVQNTGWAGQPYGFGMPPDAVALSKASDAGLSMGGAGAAPAAASVGDPVTSALLLPVAPLDLGLQHLSRMQQLGLLGPTFPGLTGLGSSPYLKGATAALQGHPPHALSIHGLTMEAGPYGSLPPEVLGRPISLPLGLLLHSGGGAAVLDAQQGPTAVTAAAAVAVQPPPWLYARPAKRHERLPAGESDDSNVSSESHAVAHGEAGTSHDEDDGRTAAGSRAARKPFTTGAGTASGASAAAAAGADLAGEGDLSCSPPEMPASAHFPRAPLARPALAAAAAEPLLQPDAPGCGGWHASPPSALAPSRRPEEATQMDIQMQELQQLPLPQLLPGPQPVILLPTLRTKGPRSRVASGSANATPTSSTQS